MRRMSPTTRGILLSIVAAVSLAILFGNVFAPVIDQLVLKFHIKRRLRHVEG